MDVYLLMDLTFQEDAIIETDNDDDEVTEDTLKAQVLHTICGVYASFNGAQQDAQRNYPENLLASSV